MPGLTNEEYAVLMDKLDKSTTLELATSLRANIFPNDDHFNLFVLCFSIVVGVESLVGEVSLKNLKKGMVQEFLRPDLFDFIFDKLTLSHKLDIFENAFSKNKNLSNKYAKFISFVREVNNNIRNNMFHCKLDNLTYKGKNLLSNIEIQRELVKDMFSYLRDSKK